MVVAEEEVVCVRHGDGEQLLLGDLGEGVVHAQQLAGHAQRVQRQECGIPATGASQKHPSTTCPLKCYIRGCICHRTQFYFLDIKGSELV